MIKIKNFNILLFFLGIVFLSAAVYRVFNYSVAMQEFSQLRVPLFFLPFTIFLEIIIGVLFLTNKKVRYASMSAAIFIVVAITFGLVSNFSNILKNITEVSVFRANPTDMLLHFVYLLIFIFIFLKYRNTTN